MKSAKTFFGIFCVLMVGLFLPVEAFAAPVIYSFIGDGLSSLHNDDPPAGEYGYLDSVEVTLTTYDGYLPTCTLPCFPNDDITPFISSWTFSDGHQTISDASATDFYLTAIVDDYGSLFAWDMWAQMTNFAYPPEIGMYNREIATEAIYYGDVRSHALREVVLYDVNHPHRWFIQFDEASGTGGRWTMSEVPIPSTMVLLLSGLIGIVGLRRKFQK